MLVFLFLVGWASWRSHKRLVAEVSNFEECARYHSVFPVPPFRCWTADGDLFIQYANDDARAQIEFPEEGDTWLVLDGELFVEGKLSDDWFFEDGFPVELWDRQGKRIAWSTAEAKERRQDEELLSFQASLFLEEEITEAVLVLFKSNPEGLSEDDDALAWPIELEYFSNEE